MPEVLRTTQGKIIVSFKLTVKFCELDKIMESPEVSSIRLAKFVLNKANTKSKSIFVKIGENKKFIFDVFYFMILRFYLDI